MPGISDEPLAAALFVSVRGAGRSQMAAGFLIDLAGDRIEVRSAGTEPVERVDPVVVEAMREVGVDITDGWPQRLTTEALRASDHVITLGCGDACPVLPHRRYLDWRLPDPAGLDLAGVRPIRDEIERRVLDLLAEIDRRPRSQAPPGAA